MAVIRTPVSVANTDDSVFLYRRTGDPETHAIIARSYEAVRIDVYPHTVVAIVRVIAWARRKAARA
jgi:hypothetical protein